MTAPRLETALQAAARIIADARKQRDSLPVRDAARLAYVAGGPDVIALEQAITKQRNQP